MNLPNTSNAIWDFEQQCFKYKCKVCSKWLVEDTEPFYFMSFVNLQEDINKDQFFHKDCFETLTSPDIVENEF